MISNIGKQKGEDIWIEGFVSIIIKLGNNELRNPFRQEIISLVKGNITLDILNRFIYVYCFAGQKGTEV